MALDEGSKGKSEKLFDREPRVEEAADFYERLGLQPGASPQQITKAFRILSKKFHPDTESGDVLKAQLLGEAYDGLGNPDKRMQYDLSHNFITPTSEAGGAFAIPREYANPDGSLDTEKVFAGLFREMDEKDEKEAREHGFQTFAQYQQYLEEEKQRPKDLTPEIRDKVIRSVRYGSLNVGRLMQGLREHNYVDAEAALSMPGFIDEIVKQILQDTYNVKIYYRDKIEQWEKAGVNRNLIDTNPAMENFIHDEFLQEAKGATSSGWSPGGAPHAFEWLLKLWERNNPTFERGKIISDERIREIIQTAVDAAKNTSDTDRYAKILTEWKAIGFDVN